MLQTSQSCSAERGGGGSADAAAEEEEERGTADADDELVLERGRADAPAEEAGADADADADADTSGEGEGGEVDNDGDVAEVDEPVSALDCFPPFFFAMGWVLGVSKHADKQQQGLVQPPHRALRVSGGGGGRVKRNGK